MNGSLRAACLVVACLLSACALPRGAAIESEVVNAADAESADFSVYPVTRALLPTIAHWPVTGAKHYGWITASAGSSSRIIRAGDVIDIIVWDASENSLLVAPEQRQLSLPQMRVSPAGSVFLPYVGNVQVAGNTPETARERVQDAMSAVAPSAQVQLALTEGRGNSVDLVGGVGAPGSYPMPDRNYTVLSLIAQGGGVAAGLANPQIRLVRGGSIYGTSVNRLFEEPRLDTRLQGGDKVIVEADERYFLSVGAAGRESLHPFTKDTVSAMDAVAIIGGVNDASADPAGVLILREYPRAALSAGQRGPLKQRVVFTLDLTEADGLFSARNFPIYSGDVIYVTESPIGGVRTVFGLIGTTFGLARQVSQ
ncbi:polysaccharide biosynthesis/export family protein [Jannaschia aquimarina]|uniref:Polysaccharide biosynthesis/export protein n=1 Tax=Jannaschia aquimarina TaxID=935700 RepID=A0A0D1D9V7_9RHOB|nr:polysaccharide biosynthesis/export family protein [Jannaschia aquimarina]KIT16678.1 Polysaccharide biosynthesis/export protein [Jannaschia aquimarina]SNS55315.1 polysaccharide export outer membrane protein [Jannaschia aquimarina]